MNIELCTCKALLGIHTSVVNLIDDLSRRAATPRLAHPRTDEVWVLTCSWAGTTLLKHLAFNRALCRARGYANVHLSLTSIHAAIGIQL